MFGYVTVCEPELKVKDLKKYRAYYCGLCRTLKEDYGFMGQMTLTYDMTFAVILLSSLYETTTKHEEHRCKVHPAKRQHMLQNEITSYAAAMNVLLAYYHMEDDWQDDRKVSSLMTKSLIQGKAKKTIEKYPRQSEIIRKSLKELGECEHENSMDIDRAAGCFGRLMAELFVWKEDIWEKTLRKMGFYLGKFIYLMYELKKAIDVYTYKTGDRAPVIEKIQTISTTSTKKPDNLTAACAMRMSVDQKYIYCTNAGENTISVYKRDEETGLLTMICCLPISGAYPKDVAVFPDGRHIASVNHDSGTISFFKVDYEKGLLVMSGRSIPVNEPNCCAIVKIGD